MKLRVNFKQIFKKKFIKYFILNVTLPVIIFYFLFEKVDLQSSYDILKKAMIKLDLSTEDRKQITLSLSYIKRMDSKK